MSNPHSFRQGEPCTLHQNCLAHVSHPCDGCGRIAGFEHCSECDKRLSQEEVSMKSTLCTNCTFNLTFSKVSDTLRLREY